MMEAAFRTRAQAPTRLDLTLLRIHYFRSLIELHGTPSMVEIHGDIGVMNGTSGSGGSASDSESAQESFMTVGLLSDDRAGICPYDSITRDRRRRYGRMVRPILVRCLRCLMRVGLYGYARDQPLAVVPGQFRCLSISQRSVRHGRSERTRWATR